MIMGDNPFATSKVLPRQKKKLNSLKQIVKKYFKKLKGA